MGIETNRRGMFFTLVAILLLSLALLSFSIFTAVTEREEITKRIDSLNGFIFSLEEDLERKLFITGFRIIFLFEKRILENGTYITAVNETFNEAFLNGTINGIIQGDEVALITGVTFNDIRDDIIASASKVNLGVSIENPRLTVSHSDPWHVHVQLETDFSIQDLGQLVSWNRSLTTEAYIPIEGFEDPIYLINTNGKIFQMINKTPHTTFVNGTNITALNDHVNNMYYTESNMSPNFLMRLEGNLSPHEQGIESLVHLPTLAAQGLTLKDKTVVDAIYFSTNNPSTNNIAGMPPWFKLDTEHHDLYGVGNITV